MNAIKSTVAAIAVKARQTEIRELPVPELGPGAGLLKIEGTGICGSDWTMYLNEKPGPRILGHEMIGTVVALGEAAQARWGVKEGDRVALEEYLPCGFCEDCRIGEYRSCAATEQRITGGIRYGSTALSSWPGLWGGYSQYLYLHPRTVFHKVPADIPLRVASMALPIGNGFQWAVLDGHAGPGKTIVIQGPGQQGLGCVLAAKSAGASMIVVSGLKRDEHRFKVARAFGAHHTVAVDEENLQFTLMRLTGGRMADIVIECSGGGPAVVNASLGLLRKRGTLLVATRKGNIPEFDNDQVVTKQITYRGVRGHSYQAVELALSTMAEGNFPLENMSTHVVGLNGLDGALKMVGGEGSEPSIHITVDPWK